MLLGRRSKIDSRVLFDRLSEGKTRKDIAIECGVTYWAIRDRISRHLRRTGIKTTEQAVAEHVAEKIKRSLPAALQSQVDQVMGRR